jgi:arylsulfatase
MLEHDELVGEVLKKLDDLGVANNTIVVYSTDNGNEFMFWPDGGYAPFRGEKGTTWEGGLRVPCMVRWPGHIKPGTDANGIQSHEDLYVTLAAAAGLPNLKTDLLAGYKMNGTTYKAHLDGYNNLDYWTGKTDKSARREIFYYDESDLMAIRVDGWKMHIGVKHNGDWFDEKSYPSIPYIVNLLMDPGEKVTPDAPGFEYAGRKFFVWKLWAPTGAGPFLAAHLKSLQDYPPRQGSDTLSMKKAIEGRCASWRVRRAAATRTNRLSTNDDFVFPSFRLKRQKATACEHVGGRSPSTCSAKGGNPRAGRL